MRYWVRMRVEVETRLIVDPNICLDERVTRLLPEPVGELDRFHAHTTASFLGAMRHGIVMRVTAREGDDLDSLEFCDLWAAVVGGSVAETEIGERICASALDFDDLDGSGSRLSEGRWGL